MFVIMQCFDNLTPAEINGKPRYSRKNNFEHIALDLVTKFIQITPDLFTKKLYK